MAATFVRLGPADLAAMAKRLNTMLTDEGAKAWYAHDVAELLQEVVALRQEIADAREALGENVLSEPAERLPDLAEQWKIHVSGLWEKAQYKKMRGEANDLRQENVERAEVIRNMAERAQQIADERNQERDEWQSKQQALQHAIRDHVETLASVEQKKQELAEALQQVTERLETKDHEFARLAMAASQELEQVKERARAVLMQGIESLS